MAYTSLARHPEAVAALNHALEIVEPFPELAPDRAVMVLGLATSLSEAGRNDEAMTLLMECRSMLAKQRDTRMELFCTNTIGSVLYRLGRYDEAVATYRGVIAEAERIDDLQLLASAHNNLARSLIERSDFTAAASHLERAAALFQSLGQPVSVSRTELARGRMLLRKGDVEAALTQVHSVREQFLRQNLVEEAGLCGLDVVEAHLARGATIEAEAFARQIVREFTAAHLNTRAITALGYLSEAIAAREVSPATVQRVRRYLGTLRQTPNAEFRATA
jgi:tetratricopeptide (TPR) repeat protein